MLLSVLTLLSAPEMFGSMSRYVMFCPLCAGSGLRVEFWTVSTLGCQCAPVKIRNSKKRKTRKRQKESFWVKTWRRKILRGKRRKYPFLLLGILSFVYNMNCGHAYTCVLYVCSVKQAKAWQSGWNLDIQVVCSLTDTTPVVFSLHSLHTTNPGQCVRHRTRICLSN